MTKCKLCGGDYKSIEAHLTSCLKKHNITREQYDTLGIEESFDEIENPTDPKEEYKGISPKEQINKIFEGQQTIIDPNRTFGDVLEEYKITIEEFIALVQQWKGEGEIPVQMKLNRKEEIGKELAQNYKDLDRAEVTNLNAAEILVKEYGFTCTDVRSGTPTRPKTWILIKSK